MCNINTQTPDSFNSRTLATPNRKHTLDRCRDTAAAYMLTLISHCTLSSKKKRSTKLLQSQAAAAAKKSFCKRARQFALHRVNSPELRFPHPSNSADELKPAAEMELGFIRRNRGAFLVPSGKKLPLGTFP